ncbi:Serine/threonine-protein phosphatase 2A activator 2 [Podospora fimiseda]|uniref:Serine/threonine-protein phosphatase 2A activator n=1 Tax=Podospora fimiseda TaxID=252190 RepID=A0AAN7BYI2_9PEZI|nr:Serine/threonine-protein phosphatase 2A activator 2 [Podospora fimiseda]
MASSSKTSPEATAVPDSGTKGSTLPDPAPRSTVGTTIPPLQSRIPKLESRRRKAAEPSNPLPVPETPPAPPLPDLSSLTFKRPTRRILSPADHELFLASPTYNLILSFIFRLSESVADKPISSVPQDSLSPTVNHILSILSDIETTLQDSPPSDQGGSRFGNKTFRIFLDKLKSKSPQWHSSFPQPPPQSSIPEIQTYLFHSFGNRARIDYGSGHELNFFMYLLTLTQLGLISPTSDFPALVLHVFPKYLTVMRQIQLTYYLEPAGSHGVWGLDDYQFLPFLFGASQLLHHPYITPRSIHQELTLEESSQDFIYLNQVAFVNSTKTVKGLRWHSPMLDDISSSKNWSKIEAGMRRMFVSEVLKKLPVMQHFLFGSLIPAVEGMSEMAPKENEDEDEELEGDIEVFDDTEGKRHVHQQSVGWGDCCGIKVPSSLAAAEEMRKRGLGGQPLRRIPFD